ncbi:hypothetical protein TNCV_3930721 [Trichonephila clavipes]|nr:hypothetical protein TNCV_3930721 [Trichonephila clavipes]
MMLWAAIRYTTRTPLAFFVGLQNSQVYNSQILRPVAASSRPRRHHLSTSNSKPHIVRWPVSLTFLKTTGVFLSRPACSLDLPH